jgi:protein bicaudal C
MFPDANDVNIKPIKRSQVTITGSINGVYLARQQLIVSYHNCLLFCANNTKINLSFRVVYQLL